VVEWAGWQRMVDNLSCIGLVRRKRMTDWLEIEEVELPAEGANILLNWN
jgi:hypothetical protein